MDAVGARTEMQVFIEQNPFILSQKLNLKHNPNPFLEILSIFFKFPVTCGWKCIGLSFCCCLVFLVCLFSRCVSEYQGQFVVPLAGVLQSRSNHR